MHPFAHSLARPLLIVHLMAATVLVASATHQLIWCRGYLRHRFERARRERWFATVATVACGITFVLGLILYPTYRVRVRAGYFDRADVGLGWVAQWFDVKEMIMLVALAAAAGLAVLARGGSHPSAEPRATPLYVGLSTLLCAASWSAALIGLYVVSYRGVR